MAGEPVELGDVASVQKLIERAVNDTLLQENCAKRSHVLGYLAHIGLKTLEVGEIEKRLEALEAAAIQLGSLRDTVGLAR